MAGSSRGRAWRAPRSTLVAAVVTGVAVLLVYRTTLLPGVFAWDTAEAQAALPLMGTMHPTGFPAFAVVGWLASVLLQPLGGEALRMNLLSALLAAGAAGTTVLLLRRLEAPLPIAVAAAIGLGFTPIVWRISTAADAHALHLVLGALVVLALVRWAGLVAERTAAPGDAGAARRADRGIVLAAALFGVALANHGLTLLLVPAVGLYVLAVDRGALRRPRLVVAALGACLGVAALLYLELPLRAGPFRAPLVYGHPDTWSGFWDIVLARQFQGDVRDLLADLPGKAAALAGFAWTQLGVLAALVPPAFLATAVRLPRYALLSGVATGITCLFAASYLNADIGRYYLVPALFAWSWLAIAAAGLPEVVLRRARRPTARRAIGASAAVLLAGALLLPTATALPARWAAVDRSDDTTMARWLDDALAGLAPDAVVVSWWSTSTTLWYGTLVEGRRPDLLIVDDSDIVYDGLGSAEAVIESYLGRRPVYVIRSSSADIAELALRYALEPAGLPAGVYRVTGTLETEP